MVCCSQRQLCCVAVCPESERMLLSGTDGISLASSSSTVQISVTKTTTLLPSVHTIALGLFCGARYTHHIFTPIIKHH